MRGRRGTEVFTGGYAAGDLFVLLDGVARRGVPLNRIGETLHHRLVNYEQVDEAQVDGETSYVASDTPGDQDIYTVADLGFVPDTVHAVQLTMCARKADVETREVRLKLKSGAVVEDGASQAMASSYQYFSDVHEEDPDAVGPWTATSVNAMQIGIETVT